MAASRKKISRRIKSSKSEKPAEWIEIPIFIHGMNPSKYPGTGIEEYRELLRRVAGAMGEKENGFSKRAIFITWGIPTKQSNAKDQYLAEVERKIETRVKASMKGAYDGPLGLYGYVRDMLFFGISDVSYYLSADGESALRDHVFNYVGQALWKMDKGAKRRYSLTFFGHSAGSVISHDLLFHLFGTKDYTRKDEGDVFDEMERLRGMIAEGRLRVRHLYTFGSPISPLILRSNSLIEKFRKDKLLQPEDIGLRAEPGLKNPRWINFWTRHDVASYPVAFLYSNQSGVIRDVEISSKISPLSAHLGYWQSDEMANHIAETF
jgi:hypothetical protein